MIRKWFLCSAALVLAGILSGRECSSDFFETKYPYAVIARAGGCGERPANTLEAFAHAISAGADVIETDARLTRDGKIVLIEHGDVSLTTNGRGGVENLTLEEIRTFDAGYHFADPNLEDPYLYRGKGMKIPTLEEAFDTFENVRMIIELKGENLELADKVAQTIDQFNRQETILAGSRNEKLIHRFRKLMPEVKTVATKSEIKSFYIISATPLGHLIDPPACVFQIPVFQGERKIAEPKFIGRCRRKKVEVCVWTLNTKDQIQDVKGLDIQGIVTDFPSLPIKLFDK